MTRRGRSGAGRMLASLGAVGATVAVTALFHLGVRSANATTVGFVYLLVVLGAASWLGFAEALLAALAATAQYNFFFLPPEGTFTIQDPRNWVALGTFLITAAVASQLSASARRRAAEAESGRRELERLYELTRASLLAETEHLAPLLERALVTIYGFADAWIEVPGRPAAATPAASAFNLRWPLRIGQRELGTLLLRGEPLGIASGETVAGIVAIALERARALQESSRLEGLRASEALKSALLDSVTHDLRTPLTSIKAAVTALLGDAAAADGTRNWRELLEVIDEESDALNGLLQSVLDMARIESGELRPRLRRQALEPIVEEAVARARGAALRTTVTVEPDLPAVLADGFLLSQALGQVLANAAAYTPAEAMIEIALRGEGGMVEIAVRDHGSGLPSAAMTRLFEKFYRDPEARRRRPEGLGMGLAIARGILEAHAGTLEAEAAVGGGMRLLFRLPAAEEDGDGHADPDR